jgi:NitT/TauT family transport system permease protein
MSDAPTTVTTTGIPKPTGNPPARRPRTGTPRWRRVLFYTGYVAILLIAWELLVRLLDIGPLVLPPPSAVFLEAIDFWGLLLRASAITLGEALIGFTIAAVVGIGLALLIAYSQTVGTIIMTSLVAFNATPKVAVAPILIIWLGLGLESKIALAFLLSFFPIVVNAARGFAEVQNDLLNLYRLMRATSMQLFLKVRVPSALPAIFDGLKIALPISMVGAVAGEFVAARDGLGFHIVLAYANFNAPFVFAAVIVIAIEATILFQILVRIENRVLYWRPSREKF